MSLRTVVSADLSPEVLTLPCKLPLQLKNVEVDTIPQRMSFWLTGSIRETILDELDHRKAVEYEAAATDDNRENQVEDDGDWEAMMEEEESECEDNNCEDEEEND